MKEIPDESTLQKYVRAFDKYTFENKRWGRFDIDAYDIETQVFFEMIRDRYQEHVNRMQIDTNGEKYGVPVKLDSKDNLKPIYLAIQNV